MERPRRGGNNKTESYSDLHIKDLKDALNARLTKEGGNFSERIPITGDGNLELFLQADWRQQLPNTGSLELTSLFAQLASPGNLKGPEALYAAAHAVQERFPEFRFSFERDPEGRWIQMSVARQL